VGAVDRAGCVGALAGGRGAGLAGGHGGLGVIGDCYLLGVGAGPAEADAPLVVDADGMLALAVPLQGFESIARRHPQEVEGDRRVDELEFDQRAPPDVARKPPGPARRPQPFGFRVGKTPDQRRQPTAVQLSVKRMAIRPADRQTVLAQG